MDDIQVIKVFIHPIEVEKLSLSLQCAAQAAIINTYCFDLFNRSVFCSDYLGVERCGHLVLLIVSLRLLTNDVNLTRKSNPIEITKVKLGLD